MLKFMYIYIYVHTGEGAEKKIYCVWLLNAVLVSTILSVIRDNYKVFIEVLMQKNNFNH